MVASAWTGIPPGIDKTTLDTNTAIEQAVNPINYKLNQIFSALRAKIGVSPRVYLAVAGDPRPNAETDGSTVVYITKGMIRMAKQDYNVLAAVLGHELAHIKLRHSYGDRSLKTLKQDELDADKLGVQTANAIGYNGMAICDFMVTMQDVLGNPPASDEHPSFRVRMNNIGCK